MAAIGAIACAVGIVSAQDPPKLKLGDRLDPGTTGPGTKPEYATTQWEQLVAPGWDPAKEFRGLDLGMLGDSDPRAMEMLERLRAEWKRAPVNPKLEGARIRIPGFVVPLERAGDKVTEFLLVPYFGACIHTPPPPANQIIHARARTPLGGLQAMNAIWASGVITVDASDTIMGHAGYRMQVHSTEPYKWAAK